MMEFIRAFDTKDVTNQISGSCVGVLGGGIIIHIRSTSELSTNFDISNFSFIIIIFGF